MTRGGVSPGVIGPAREAWQIRFEQRRIQLCPVQPLLSDHEITSKAGNCNEREKWSVYWRKQLHASERKKNTESEGPRLPGVEMSAVYLQFNVHSV